MHTATPDEIDRATEIATRLHAQFNRLMDARAGVGSWSDPKPEIAPREHAAMVAGADVLGWLYVAKSGRGVRAPLDKTLQRIAGKIESWGLPVPEIIRTGPNARIEPGRCE